MQDKQFRNMLFRILSFCLLGMLTLILTISSLESSDIVSSPPMEEHKLVLIENKLIFIMDNNIDWFIHGGNIQ